MQAHRRCAQLGHSEQPWHVPRRGTLSFTARYNVQYDLLIPPMGQHNDILEFIEPTLIVFLPLCDFVQDLVRFL